jgi:tetratricopeptide (TPR) repeat protein
MATQPNYRAIAYEAAMKGRQIAAVEAASKMLSNAALSGVQPAPGTDWALGCLYEVMIRFGDWNGILQKKLPHPSVPGVQVAHFQARAIALASTNRIAEAKEALAALEKIIAETPADARQGANSARALYEIAALKAKARIAYMEKLNVDFETGLTEQIAFLQEALVKEDALTPSNPPDSFIPVRHFLGSALINNGRDSVQAEAVYREDLRRNPKNPWSLRGLCVALEWQGKFHELPRAQHEFNQAWSSGADTSILNSVN